MFPKLLNRSIKLYSTTIRSNDQLQINFDTDKISDILCDIDLSIHLLGEMILSIPICTLTTKHFDLIVKLNKSAAKLI